MTAPAAASTLRDILVILDDTAHAEARLTLAGAIARRFGARLTGLRCADTSPRVPLRQDPAAVAIMAQLLDRMQRDIASRTAGLEKGFAALLRKQELDGEWRQAEGAALDEAPRHAMGADLVVLGEPDPADTTSGRLAVIEALVFASGRPVLVQPWRGRFPDAGQRVLIAWDGVRETARAVHDALPLLKRAAQVRVLAPDTGGGPEGAGPLLAHLLRHGIAADSQRPAPQLTPAEALLAEARAMQSDLLVMGAAAVSQDQGLALGGLAPAMLLRMKLPLLLSR